MTEWKPEAGEDAVVRVTGHMITTDGQKHAFIEGTRATIPVSALRPLPPALSAEDAAVLRLGEIASEDRAKAAVYWGSSQAHAAAATSEHALWRAFERRRSTAAGAVAQEGAWVPKAGDRVRVKDDPKWLRCGKRGIVRRTDVWNGGSVAYVKFDELDGPPLCYDFSGLEPDPDPEPATPRDTTAPPPNIAALERTLIEAIGAIVKMSRRRWQDRDPKYDNIGWDEEGRAVVVAYDALLAAEAPADPTPKESMAETLWPFIKHSMRGCERMEWARVNRGSAAWDMAMHAAEAALSALGDRGPG